MEGTSMKEAEKNPTPENKNKDKRTADERCEDARRATRLQVFLLAAYLVVGCVFLLFYIARLWSGMPSLAPPEEAATEQVSPAGDTSSALPYAGEPAGSSSVEVVTSAEEKPRAMQTHEGREARVIWLVILVGALGSYVHVASSFVTFVGNRKLIQSWLWWYVLRPFVGAALAVIFYFVIRAGLITIVADEPEINLFGAVAIAALTGMFSKNAIDKLGEVFQTVFKTKPRTGGDDVRKDKLASLTPVTEAMIPAHCITSCTLPADEGDGENLITGESKVKINDLLKLAIGVVTRIPILTKDRTVKYVIHASMLYKYVAKKCTEACPVGGAGFDSQALNLQDFLEFERMKDLVVGTLVYVDCDAMVTEAKEKMDKQPNCQDVIVTKTGRSDEPILGWLTNIDIARYTDA
jgi:hypothetical protein